eukprot:Gb_00568 [translate_table: standard]
MTSCCIVRRNLASLACLRRLEHGR